ncbi:MAG: 23S rRNA (pseudouridine(1915)-N(3))-methyltransferase RlmH [Rickettsiales bacterium]|nr:23S rRNA (pseudouridine(1915)-N(3))-methyltransferase RlmH [Rickettsiales bacterium]
MKFIIISVGKIPNNAPEHDIIQEYQKKLPWKIEFKELKAENNLKKTAQKMLLSIDKKDLPILLDTTGKHYSSEDFASYLNNLNNTGINRIALLIGGAEGVHKNISDAIQNVISLGHMTYSHKLAKIILVEQLYRSWAILSNHPYPK